MEGEAENSIKESARNEWLKEDEKCPSCGQVTKRARGINRQNLKNLTKVKWSWNEVLITLLLIMVLIEAYAYINAAKQSNEWMSQMHAGNYSQCLAVCDSKCSMFGNALSGEPMANNADLRGINITNSKGRHST